MQAFVLNTVGRCSSSAHTGSSVIERNTSVECWSDCSSCHCDSQLIPDAGRAEQSHGYGPNPSCRREILPSGTHSFQSHILLRCFHSRARARKQTHTKTQNWGCFCLAVGYIAHAAQDFEVCIYIHKFSCILPPPCRCVSLACARSTLKCLVPNCRPPPHSFTHSLTRTLSLALFCSLPPALPRTRIRSHANNSLRLSERWPRECCCVSGALLASMRRSFRVANSGKQLDALHLYTLLRAHTFLCSLKHPTNSLLNS